MMISLAVLTAVAALQTPPPPPAPPSHGVERVIVLGGPGGGLDADGDGWITREEFSAPIAEGFARMDTDGDGRVSAEEMRAHPGPAGPGAPGRVMMFRQDGAAPGGARRIDLTSEDGTQRRVIVIGGDGEMLDMPPPPHPPLPPGAGGPGERRVFVHRSGPGGAEGPGGAADLDRDGDGKVSREEFIAPLAEAFARMDADSSGYLEEGERGNSRVRVIRREGRPGDGD